jgi:hypothetical protein
MCPLYFHSHSAYCCLVEADPFLKGQYSVDAASESGHLQRLPQTVTKWFAPAPLDVASYDIELKMEIQL